MGKEEEEGLEREGGRKKKAERVLSNRPHAEKNK